MIIDLHSCILPSSEEAIIDFEGALQLVRQAYDQDVKHIYVTQNISDKASIKDFNQLVNNIANLNNNLQSRKIDISVRPGIRLIYSDHLDHSNNFKVESLTINKAGKYLLVQLPPDFNISSLESFFYKLQIRGIVPIISNAENVKKFQSHPEVLYELVHRSGALVQISVQNLFGRSDAFLTETLKMIIQKRLFHLLASGSQYPALEPYRMTDGYSLIEKWTSSEYVHYLKTNAQSVFYGHYFPIYQPLPLLNKPFNRFVKYKLRMRTSGQA